MSSAVAFGTNITALEGAPLHLDENGRRQRAELISAILLLHDRGAIQFGGSANASVRLSENPDHILVTSRGLPRDISEDDFGIVSLSGDFIGGALGKGVRSVIQMHTHAYKRPGVGAVIHTHSPYATTFAVAHKPIPAHYEPLLNKGQRVTIPVSTYGDRNTGEMVGKLDALLEEHSETRAVLLANHGLLAFHETPTKTAELVVSIEETAALVLRASLLGGSQAPF
ncbi:L-fuculose-phosphate aldolase [Rhizobium sp. PP-CC-3A-592]|nr:L-fuculose-phosphate aldolase [Rhizobium sp. PP-CC-3A-592]